MLAAGICAPAAACTSATVGFALRPSETATADRTTASPATAAAATATAATPTRVVLLHTADGERTAIVHHPRTARPGAALVVVLHPAGSSASDSRTSLGWDEIADRAGFVVAYPEGTLDGLQDTWNGGRCCAPASELGTDDTGFLHQLVTALRGTDDLGKDVYAVGFSNGGMLAYAWACRWPKDLAGIGVVAGALVTDCPAPAPLTVVVIHGDADDSIPLKGGGNGPGGLDFPAVDRSLAPFRAAARCTEPPVTTRQGRATVAEWTCGAGRRVIRDVVAGVGHAWPGAGPTAGRSTQPADATDATGFLFSRLRPSG